MGCLALEVFGGARLEPGDVEGRAWSCSATVRHVALRDGSRLVYRRGVARPVLAFDAAGEEVARADPRGWADTAALVLWLAGAGAPPARFATLDRKAREAGARPLSK